MHPDATLYFQVAVGFDEFEMMSDVLKQVGEAADAGGRNHPDQSTERLLIGKSPWLQMQRVDAASHGRGIDKCSPVKHRELHPERRLHRFIKYAHFCF